MSFGGERENPPRERLDAGDAVVFSYYIGLFRGFQRAMETDEVCGRPLDAFAFTSHVTMEKTGRGGTDDGSARGHSVQLSPTESRERVKGGDFVPFHSPLQGAGTASLLGSRGKAPWVFQRPCHPNGGGGNSGKSGQVGAGVPHASHRVM